MSLERRLRTLEERVPPPRVPPSSSGARERMSAYLGRVAAVRRAGATLENNAELRAIRDALERRREQTREDRGEGRR